MQSHLPSALLYWNLPFSKDKKLLIAQPVASPGERETNFCTKKVAQMQEK